jgi:hypothetical protein
VLHRPNRSNITFPALETPESTTPFITLGFRINGLWLLRAQELPCVPGAAPRLLGTMALSTGLDREQWHLEPGLVARQAHMWVSSEAAAAGLQIVDYQRLPQHPQDILHSTSCAQYVVAHA